MFIKGAPDYLIEKSNRAMTSNGAIVNLDS